MKTLLDFPAHRVVTEAIHHRPVSTALAQEARDDFEALRDELRRVHVELMGWLEQPIPADMHGEILARFQSVRAALRSVGVES